MRVPIGVPGEGLGSGSGGWRRVALAVDNKGKGEGGGQGGGVGGGVGTGKGTGKSIRKLCRSGTKKGHKHKEFGQKPPLPDPPPKKPLTPQILSVWGLFSLQNTQEKAYINNFEGGGFLGAPNFFMLNFFACFFCKLCRNYPLAKYPLVSLPCLTPSPPRSVC